MKVRRTAAVINMPMPIADGAGTSVGPLEDMLAGTLPGEIKAKTACIMLDIALIGPQFVSPNTRKPTSIKGRDNTIAINESQTGMPMLKYWTRQITTAMTIEPITTY